MGLSRRPAPGLHLQALGGRQPRFAERCPRRGDGGLHLHRRDGGHGHAGLDRLPSATVTETTPCKSAATWPGRQESTFLPCGHLGRDRAIPDPDRSQVAVEGTHDGLADRLDADQQLFALVELDSVLNSGLQSVEVFQRRHGGHVTPIRPGLLEVARRAGEHGAHDGAQGHTASVRPHQDASQTETARAAWLVDPDSTPSRTIRSTTGGEGCPPP